MRKVYHGLKESEGIKKKKKIRSVMTGTVTLDNRLHSLSGDSLRQKVEQS